MVMFSWNGVKRRASKSLLVMQGEVDMLAEVYFCACSLFIMLFCYDRMSWTIIFLLSIPPSFPSSYCTMDTLPSLLVIVLSWTYLPIPRLGQDALRTVRFLPYLLHALPSPLLYYLCVHQYLLMCTLHAPPMPTPPHCYLMYHCTVCAHYQTP
jgi:hypothetical protein